MQNLSKLKPIPVRFTERSKQRIGRAARKFNLPASEIIRQAVEQQLPEWEERGSLTILAVE